MTAKRDYENDVPVDDALVVLDLLCRRWGDNSLRELIRVFRRQGELPYVEVSFHRDFGDPTYLRYEVTDRVADELLARHLVGGKPEWGYTDMNRLRINSFGENILWEARKAAGLDECITAGRWLRRRSWA